MGRFSSFSGVQKAIAAATAQTITFPANEIVGAGVVAYHVVFDDGGADVDDILRIRVRASGDPIIDCTPAQLRARDQAWNARARTNLGTDNFLTIPLNMSDQSTRAMRDRMQFPPGAQPQVEIEFANSVSGGSNAIIGWTQTDVEPQFTGRFYTSQLNIPASIRSGRFSFSDGGVIVGAVLPQAGVDRARLEISGRQAFRVTGPQYVGGTWGNMLAMTDVMEQGRTITDPLYVPVELGLPAAQGSSFLELDTGAGWAGTANEMALQSIMSLAETGANGG